MAIFKPGPLATDITGSVGGVTFVRHRGNNIARHRPAKKKKTSARALAHRARYARQHNAWVNLTPLERLAWRIFAAQYATTNRLGLPRNLTAYQCFMKTALPLDGNFGPPVLTNPPLYTSIMPTISTWQFQNGGGKTITIANGTLPTTAYIWGARPITTNPLRTFNRWTFLTKLTNSVSPQTLDFTTAWDQLLGDPAVGETCAVRIYTKRESEYATAAQFRAGAAV